MNLAWEILLALLLLVGCFFTLLGAIGLVKLSDFFRRIHGPAKASTLGVGCILAASVAYHAAYGSGLHPRELLITVFLFLTAPVSAHLMSRAALSLMDKRMPHPGEIPGGDVPADYDARTRDAGSSGTAKGVTGAGEMGAGDAGPDGAGPSSSASTSDNAGNAAANPRPPSDQ